MNYSSSGAEVVRSADVSFDAAADVVVVGTGAGGYAAAVTAAQQGATVIQLEKAPQIGGTTRKAAAAFWIPNNRHMRRLGLADEKPEALRYMARLTSPITYNPAHPYLGLTQWQHTMISAFYDHAGDAVAQLEAWKALEPVPAELPDYYMHLPEDAAPIGRLFSPHLRGAGEDEVGDGRDMIAALSEAASSAGVELRTGHRVSQAVVSDSGAVVGVVADTRHGQVTLRARRGVVFASGGFTHNAELRRNYLPAPVLSGCAASSNTGDFLPIALALGADLVNMGAAWLAPMVLDHALGNDPEATCCFNIPGDSMIFVNRSGRRVVNEKAPYHDLGSAFWAWESQSAQYPNMVLVMIWDDSAKAHYSTDQYGSPLTPDGSDQSHIVSAPDLGQLASALRTRLTDASDHLGGWQLEDRFETNLRETILRYNTQARAGLDQDFRRGETPIEQAFHGPARTGNAMNPTMWPISSEGPYHATLLCSATLDTKGGPRTNPDGQVLDRSGAPITGLYGVGNCVGAMSGASYWAAGATLGPILTFGYLAGKSVAS